MQLNVYVYVCHLLSIAQRFIRKQYFQTAAGEGVLRFSFDDILLNQ
jgi:hypothetical protein